MRTAAIGEAERNAYLLFHDVTNKSNPVWPDGEARLYLDEKNAPSTSLTQADCHRP